MEAFSREGHDGVTFFIGPEVEHTPAFSKKTLFVVGKQDVEQIEKLARTHKTPHIFMGANHSFDPNQGDADLYWKTTITKLLDKGFYVSIDYPAHLHEKVLPMFTKGVWQCRTFIPLLHVVVPNIQTSSPNLTIKIDDVNFKATNPGVWCMNVHEVTDSNRFTDWQEYGTDVVIGKEETVVPTPVAAQMKVQEVKRVQKNNPVVVDTNPMGLDVEAPSALNVVKAEETVVPGDLNDPMGLDPDSPSKLKPDPAEDVVPSVFVPKTADAVADLYAEGTSEDTLSKGAPKKTKAAKKVA